jgi:hypothetical protein
MTWAQAIRQVLLDNGSAMHYVEIAKQAVGKGYKTNSATPDYTVAAVLTDDIKKGAEAQFLRLGNGYYALAETGGVFAVAQPFDVGSPLEDAPAPAILAIRAYGIYWERSKVDWQPSVPSLFGRQHEASPVVDLSKQRGVYLLYDGRELVYVGRSVDLGITVRLRDHTVNRLRSRWDRFSWFGLSPVTESGDVTIGGTQSANLAQVVALLEAVLIEALEPRLNRQKGQGFEGAEFLQVEDPSLAEKQKKAMLAHLVSKL